MLWDEAPRYMLDSEKREEKTYPWIRSLNGLLYIRKHVKEKRRRDGNVRNRQKSKYNLYHHHHMIQYWIQYFMTDAAELSTGSGIYCIRTGLKENQSSVLTGATVSQNFKVLSLKVSVFGVGREHLHSLYLHWLNCLKPVTYRNSSSLPP